MSKGLFISVAACAVMAGWGAGAQAQTASDAKPTAVGEVVVTAERRETSAQKVSIALTVLAGRTCRRKASSRSTTWPTPRPALRSSRPSAAGQPEFRIRGVGFQDYASNNAPTVGVYVNEVAYPIPIMTQGALLRHLPDRGAARAAGNPLWPQHHRRRG